MRIPPVALITVAIIVASSIAALINSGHMNELSGGSKTDRLANLLDKTDKAIGSQEYAEALNFTNQAIALDSSDSRLLAKRGDIFVLMHDPERGITNYSAALKFNPENDKALLDRASCYYATRAFQTAMADYQFILAMKESKYHDQARLGEALCHYSLGQYPLAIHQCRELLKTNPKYLKAIELLGNSHLREGDYLDAVDAYTTGLRLDHDNGDLYFGRSSAYFKTKMVDKSLADLEKAVRCSPKNFQYRLQLATIARLLKKKDLAQAQAEEALKLNPASKEASAVLEWASDQASK